MKPTQPLTLFEPGQRYSICTDKFWAMLKCDRPFVYVIPTVTDGSIPEDMQAQEVPLDNYSFANGYVNLNKLELATRLFKFSYEVVYRGKLFGKIHLCPRSKQILDNTQMKFELENNVHYEQGWLTDFKHILSVLSCSVQNVSQLDIAIDGQGFMKMIKMWEREEIDKTGKAKIQEFKSSKRFLSGFDVGSRASEKWVCCYGKSDEIKKSNKQYIADYWKRSGINTEKPVERLELRLRNEALKMIFDFDWQRLDDFEYLASIFRTFIEGGMIGNPETGKEYYSNGLMNFVVKTKDTNITRAQRIQFIDWDCIGAVPLDRLSTQQTNEVYRMKMAVKTHSWIFMQTGKEIHLQLAREMAENINCIDWMHEHWEYWQKELKGKRLDYIPHYKQSFSTQQLQLVEVGFLEKYDKR